MQMMRADVERQRERELNLQKRYAAMKVKLGEARREYHATVSGAPISYPQA